MSENIVRINMGGRGVEKSFAINCRQCCQTAGKICLKDSGEPYPLEAGGLLVVHVVRWDDAKELEAKNALPNISIGCACGQQMPSVALFMVDGKQVKCADCLTKQEAPPVAKKQDANKKHEWDPNYES